MFQWNCYSKPSIHCHCPNIDLDEEDKLCNLYLEFILIILMVMFLLPSPPMAITGLFHNEPFFIQYSPHAAIETSESHMSVQHTTAGSAVVLSGDRELPFIQTLREQKWTFYSGI